MEKDVAFTSHSKAGIPAGSGDWGVRNEVPCSCPQSPGLREEGLEPPSSIHAGLGSVWGQGVSDLWLIPARIPHPGGLAAQSPVHSSPFPACPSLPQNPSVTETLFPREENPAAWIFVTFFYFSLDVVIFIPPYKSLPGFMGAGGRNAAPGTDLLEWFCDGHSSNSCQGRGLQLGILPGDVMGAGMDLSGMA